MGKFGLFHLRRLVPCKGFRLRRRLRTPARAARPASRAVSAPQSACDRFQVKFAAGTASLSLFHGRRNGWVRSGEGSAVKRIANAVVKKGRLPRIHQRHNAPNGQSCSVPHIRCVFALRRQDQSRTSNASVVSLVCSALRFPCKSGLWSRSRLTLPSRGCPKRLRLLCTPHVKR